MIDHILSKAKRRFDAAEVFYTDSAVTELSYDAGVLKNTERKNVSGIALRVIQNGRTGFSSTTDPDRLDDLIDRAGDVAKFGKEAGFEFPASAEPVNVLIHDEAVVDYGVDLMASEGKRAVELLRTSCPDALPYVNLGTVISHVRIANTSGLDVSLESTSFQQSVTLNIVDGDSILWIEKSGESADLVNRTDEFVADVSGHYKRLKHKSPKISGRMPVIFTACQLPNLFRAIELGVNGLGMIKGETPLIGRIGEKVLGDVTITDDPTVDGAIGSRPFDAEGVTSHRRPLFTEGIFNGFLFNLDTAAAASEVSTGNATRLMLESPSIAPSNLVVEPGHTVLEEMVAEIEKGIIVHSVIGGGQSNLVAGDFAVNVMLGYLVRNGEIEGRLVDTMLSGNVYDAFADGAVLGSESVRTGNLIAPDILFNNLAVSG